MPSSVLMNLLFTQGTPEVGGLTVMQGLEIVRGCKGLNLVGADLVEVCLLLIVVLFPSSSSFSSSPLLFYILLR